MGNDSVASAGRSHPRHRLFGQATPGPAPPYDRGGKTRHPLHGKCHEVLTQRGIDMRGRKIEFRGVGSRPYQVVLCLGDTAVGASG